MKHSILAAIMLLIIAAPASITHADEQQPLQGIYTDPGVLEHRLFTGWKLLDDNANVVLHSFWPHSCVYADQAFSHGAIRDGQKCLCVEQDCGWVDAEAQAAIDAMIEEEATEVEE